jgi:hypothetical protein
MGSEVFLEVHGLNVFMPRDTVESAQTTNEAKIIVLNKYLLS